jgi:alanine racemase
MTQPKDTGLSNIEVRNNTAGGLTNPVGRVTINLDAVIENYNTIKRKTYEGCNVAAVVKANGFGLGALELTKALTENGCKDFFVATPYEGAEIRKYFKGCNIYVLNGFFDDETSLYLDHNLTPILNSLIEVQSYNALSAQQNNKLSAFLNFNIRMNRLGLAATEQEKIFNDPSILNHIDITGVMSHFACADEPEAEMNDIQFQGFKQIADQFPGALKTLSNSSGIFRNDTYHFDLVRPGAALYGLNPTPKTQNPMSPVVHVELPVLRTRLVYKGATVGYNSTYQFTEDTWIATLSCGYADGLFRSLSNSGAVYFNGKRCPIRGRISMDLTTIDLSALNNDERPKPGDFVELLGNNQCVDALAEDAGTIGYEVLTNLGRRYKFSYKKNGEIIEKQKFLG